MGGGVREGTSHRNSKPESRESSERVCGLPKSRSTLTGEKKWIGRGTGRGSGRSMPN